MLGAFAEVERREIAERTMRGKRAAAAKGKFPQGNGAGIFGYDYDPSIGRHQLPKEASV
jgi:DNA invertase Pin-like site-specific DNA recombinase